jgi:predicted Zn finger-like uncharacterized protein
MLAARCPWCETVFRLTKEQAAIRAGMARCGVCNHTFNALDYLVRGSDLGPGPERKLTAPKVNFVDDLGELVEVERQAPEPVPIAPPGRPEPKLSPRLAGADEPDEADNEPALGRRAEDKYDLGERRLSEPSFLRSARGEEQAPRGAALTWAVLSFIALVGLVAQGAYVWRSEMVARIPELRPALEAACGLLHCRVEPPADISQIAIESSALEAVPGRKDAMTFTALLHNSSSLPGRYPAIELTLTDSQDRPMIRRVLKPSEYLAPPERERFVQGLGPNSELPVKLVFDVAGGGVAGYRVAVFYP